jgi:7,8-dihydropterin-6-yl-methyl-4-(beta-D-ribofuranosyl)aminobenzene 5'-phosphate synthase
VDDQAIVINVYSKGLVVITGCGHSGIINTLLFAQQVTGISKIYTVLGGFHLTGSDLEPVIPILWERPPNGICSLFTFA